MYALVDCNNFYASCERLFRPDLADKPLIVLSNNDGCVIARSNEAKQLGIQMGEPYFRVKALCKTHHVRVFSSNFPLYGDLSTRIMTIIQNLWPETEIYSIDEAFLDLSSLPPQQQIIFCTALHKTILKHTGIPTSIGIGSTKTLAKISNHLCKKKLHIPVFSIHHQPHWLKHIVIGDVWGVGRQWQQKLVSQGIHTAHDLATVELPRYKNCWNVMLLRTAMELRGIRCFPLQHHALQQSILSSKSFAPMQTDLLALSQAISSHCARAWEKLRAQSLTTQQLSVFIRTNRHRSDLPAYHPVIDIKLTHPTDDIRIITAQARKGLKQIFKTNFHYKKAGICLTNLTPKYHAFYQYDLFDNVAENHSQKTEKLMSVFDKINQKFGQHTVKLAAEGNQPRWRASSNMRSPCYTTRWTDLPVIKNDT